MNTTELVSRGLSLAVCSALFLGPVRAASAAGPEATWAQTFDSSAVAAHVAAQGQGVAILSGGAPSRRLKDVTRALQEELESSGTTGTVRVAGASKRTAGLDDAGLIERADAEDAARLVVVRVDEGDEARATVSVYSADADALGGFSAARGDVIEPPTETSHGGDSVLAVLTTPDGVLADDDEAVLEYRRKRVVFDGALRVTSTGNGSAVVSRTFAPTTGVGTPLPNDEYYAYVGRDDLAQEFRRRRAAKVGMTVGGSLLVFTGLTVMLAVPLAAVIRNESSDCDAGFDATDAEMMAQQMCESDADATQRRKVRQGLGIGGALFGGGLVFTVVGGKMKAHTSSAAELQEMGEDYNRGLRKRLNVREVASVQVAPTAHREGGGVVLSGRF